MPCHISHTCTYVVLGRAQVLSPHVESLGWPGWSHDVLCFFWTARLQNSASPLRKFIGFQEPEKNAIPKTCVCLNPAPSRYSQKKLKNVFGGNPKGSVNPSPPLESYREAFFKCRDRDPILLDSLQYYIVNSGARKIPPQKLWESKIPPREGLVPNWLHEPTSAKSNNTFVAVKRRTHFSQIRLSCVDLRVLFFVLSSARLTNKTTRLRS